VHIQTGADLAVERVADSLQMAKDFFPRVFPETPFQAMVCYSWLLHSGLKDLLPPNSRILLFAENFEVVSETGDKRQAMERIFWSALPEEGELSAANKPAAEGFTRPRKAWVCPWDHLPGLN